MQSLRRRTADRRGALRHLAAVPGGSLAAAGDESRGLRAGRTHPGVRLKLKVKAARIPHPNITGTHETTRTIQIAHGLSSENPEILLDQNVIVQKVKISLVFENAHVS